MPVTLQPFTVDAKQVVVSDSHPDSIYNILFII